MNGIDQYVTRSNKPVMAAIEAVTPPSNDKKDHTTTLTQLFK